MAGNAGGGWQPDPMGRHQLRYFDGSRFTGYVCDDGVNVVDAGLPDGPASPWDSVGMGRHAPPRAAGPPPAWPAAGGPPPGYGGHPPPNAPSPYSGNAWPGAVPATPPKRRRIGMGLVIGLAVLEGVVIVALSVALLAANTATPTPSGSAVAPSGTFGPSMGAVVYSSHFGPGDHWFTGQVNANTTISLSNGRYVVQASTGVHHLLLTPYQTPHAGMSVEAGVTAFPSTNVSVGVGCQSAFGISPALVYQVVAFPNGGWYIEEGRVAGSVKTLASGFTSDLGPAATVELTCVITDTSGGGQTTQLVAYVNGTRVGAIGERIAQSSVGGYIPVLLVGSFGPTVSASFTDVTVRSINSPV